MSGYKDPPVKSRFKPGTSGNPKGRPRGSINLSSVVARVLNDENLLNKVSQKPSWWTELPQKNAAYAITVAMAIKAMNGDYLAATWLGRHAAQGSSDLDGPPSILTARRIEDTVVDPDGTRAELGTA